MYINKHQWNEAIVFWDQNIDKSAPVDVFYLLHEYSKPKEGLVSEHINFITELTSGKPEEKFSSSTRRKWRKIKEDFKFEILNNISEEDLQFVIDQYNEFAENAGLTKMDGNIYKQMNNEGKLYVTYVKKNDVIEYIHTFYASEGIARLFHTFPSTEVTNKNCNIALHREDLILFKNLGFKKYDWGGAGFKNEDDEKKLSIREYKRRFGGSEIIYYKSRIANTETGKEIIKNKYKVK